MTREAYQLLAPERRCSPPPTPWTARCSPSSTAWSAETVRRRRDSCMGDSAHDKEHIYRVLYSALDIAQGEAGVDYDVLIAACLLHDIARAPAPPDTLPSGPRR